MMFTSTTLSYIPGLKVVEKNNKDFVSSKERKKVFAKHKVSEVDVAVLTSLSYLLYATSSQIAAFFYLQYPMYEFSASSIDKMVAYGFIRNIQFEKLQDNVHYKSSCIFSLTQSGKNYLTEYTDSKLPEGKCHMTIYPITSEADYITILNRVAFNNFYVKVFPLCNKVYLSYRFGNHITEGRCVISSDYYSMGFVNLYVFPVRNIDSSYSDCLHKLQSAIDFCMSEKQKLPWFLFICEDEVHVKKLYSYLNNHNMFSKSVLLFTKDTYLLREDAKPFDNIISFKMANNELVSLFEEIKI